MKVAPSSCLFRPLAPSRHDPSLLMLSGEACAIEVAPPRSSLGPNLARGQLQQDELLGQV